MNIHNNQSTNFFLKKMRGKDRPRCYVMKVIHSTESVLAHTRPNQLRWNDWEMGTVALCTKCSQVVCLIHATGRISSSNIALLCTAVIKNCCYSILV